MNIDNIVVGEGAETEFRVKLEESVELIAHLKKGTNDRLFVVFNGAVDLSKTHYPYYQRWSWSDKFPGNVLYIADPLINAHKIDNLTLGWYMGGREFLLDQIIARFVAKVAHELNCEGRVISYGSSGGGFASLKLAQNSPDVFAVAVNPQTDILKYHEPSVDRYLNLAWRMRIADLSQLDRDRLRIASFENSQCLIIQNTEDVFHLKHHFETFLRINGVESGGMGRLGDGISFLKFRDPKGHGPESIEMLDLIVSTAIALSEGNCAPSGVSP